MVRAFFALAALMVACSPTRLVLPVAPPRAACEHIDGTPTCAALAGGQTGCCIAQADGTQAQWVCPEDVKGIARASEVREIAGVIDAAEVEVGRRGACIRTASGNVRCFGWDDGEYHRLFGACRIAPVAVTIPGLYDVVSLSGSCALLRDGSFRCWGTGPKPPSVTGVRQLEGACAVLDTGRLECGGELPSAFGRLDDLDELRLDETSGCARRHGHVRCWGSNAQGELGIGTTGEQTIVPVVVAGLDGATQLGAAAGARCALVDGSAYCWGRRFGPTPRKVSGTLRVLRLALGAGRVCGIGEDQRVRCWESGGEELLEGFGRVVSLSAGQFGLCAVGEDGRVRCQGTAFTLPVTVTGQPRAGGDARWSDADLLPARAWTPPVVRCTSRQQYCLGADNWSTFCPLEEDACLDTRAVRGEATQCVPVTALTFEVESNRCLCVGQRCANGNPPLACAVIDPLTERPVDAARLADFCAAHLAGSETAISSSQRARFCTQLTWREPNQCRCPVGPHPCSCGTHLETAPSCARSLQACEVSRRTALGKEDGRATPCVRVEP